MSAIEAQPAPATAPAHIIDLCDRSLAMVGLASYSDLVVQIERLEQMAALRFAQVYRLTADLSAVAVNIHRNTDASLDEAVERATSGTKRGAAYLQQADARPDLRDLPANVTLMAAHRVEIAGGAR